MDKTLRVSEEIWKQLWDLKTQYGFKRIEDTINFLIQSYYTSLTIPESKKATKPITYPGGDWYIKDDIIDILVKSNCRTLVEVFGGSGVITMYSPNEVFKVKIYNDIDKELVNFFKVLKENPFELQKVLSVLPFSRALREELINKNPEELSDVERAAIYFYKSETMFKGPTQYVDSPTFKVVKSRPYARTLSFKVADLILYSKMWKDVTIENQDFRNLIKSYDAEFVVFYCDPPFLIPGKKGYYKFSFKESDMKELLDLLSSIKGKFVLKLNIDQVKHYEFIKEFALKYKNKVIEHALTMSKVKSGQERKKQYTVLIFNYEAS